MVDGGGSAGPGTVRRIVLSAPLCFAVAKLGSMPPKEMRAVMLGFFTGDQIYEASKLLLAEMLLLKPNLNRKIPACRTSKDNPDAKSKLEIDDFLSLVASADEASLLARLPIFATADPDAIPSRQQLEGGFKVILQQLAAMTEQFAEVRASLAQVGPSGSYSANFPPMEGVDYGNADTHPSHRQA